MDRRQFLELTAAVSGTGWLAASMPWLSAFHQPAPVGRAASDRLRLAVVGVGGRGLYLMHTLNRLSTQLNAEVVAVCDDHAPHLERALAQSEAKVNGYADHRDLFGKERVDGVVIATPPAHHAAQADAAFDAGAHVYCEKILARTLEDVRRMYDRHLDEDKILVVGFQKMFSPAFVSAIERIRRGEIGPVSMVRGNWHRNRSWIEYPGIEPGSALDRKMNWRLYKESCGGMITELSSHHLQIANWVFDEQPVSVVGSGSIHHWKDQREVWDNFGLVFRYPDGAHFVYDVLQSNKHNGVRIQALGKEGLLDMEANRHYVENPPAPPAIRRLIHDIESRIFDVIPIGSATWIPAEPVDSGGSPITDRTDVVDTELYLEAFCDFIRKGAAPESLTLQGYRASAWSLVAEQATYSGKTETLPLEYRR